MRLRFWVLAVGIFVLPGVVEAEVKVAVGRSEVDAGFAFASVPPPAVDDAAAAARFTLVDGPRDPNSGPLDVLHDGRVPTDEDQPAANFFFRAGAAGGRVLVDLGKAISVKRVGTYSWHANTRAPQVYTLYAAAGTEAGFQQAPPQSADPAACGWKRLAQVDTRTNDGAAGQHGVAITDSAGPLGAYRYLLFDMAATENRDPFGNTFYSEIDVIDADRPAPSPIEAPKTPPIVRTFAAEGDKVRFTVDATLAPDLAEWSEKKLAPVVQEWYPKIVALLPSEGYQAPTNIVLRFRADMGGTPASAGGAKINLNAAWFRRERDREALGAVVHEMVHVVQSFGNRRASRGSAAPSWLVEGMADYVRWFLYEPQTKGAEITRRNFPEAKYNSSYRISANFLNWVVEHHDREIVRKLNAAAREGRYSEQLWKDWTGASLSELGEQWKAFHQRRLAGRQ